jgi:type IV pilus assembly protein PilW
MIRGNSRGWSLLELMVGLAIASIVLTGAISLLAHSRDLLEANDSVSRLQDQARHALSVLVRDLEHAGSYGFGLDHRTLRIVRDGDPLLAIASGDDLRQDAPPVPLPASIHGCGANFAVDLSRAVEASNNRFAAGVDASRCDPTASAGGAMTGADTLTVRHATEIASPMPGRLQLLSNRFTTRSGQTLFADGRAPGPSADDADTFDVVVRTYYVARSSVERAGWPALRVKSLTTIAGSPAFRDEEILPGVEDLQVQFGIAESGASGPVTRFVDPNAAELLTLAPRAVRIWLRIRAEATERGYRDDRAWRYADTEFAPAASEQGIRRLLVSRTVTLRTRDDEP